MTPHDIAEIYDVPAEYLSGGMPARWTFTYRLLHGSVPRLLAKRVTEALKDLGVDVYCASMDLMADDGFNRLVVEVEGRRPDGWGQVQDQALEDLTVQW